MGNRAVITEDMNGIGIYLHWNGGRDSVEAFLKYCKLRGFRTGSYGMARLAQVISNFFGGGLSVGIGLCSNLDCDNGDNGTYIIKDWEIVGRKYFDWDEQNEYDINEMLEAIDEAQPLRDQIGDFLEGKEIPVSYLKPGDKIAYIDDLYETVKKAEIVGIGKAGKVVNGTNVEGIPYINAYGTNPENNINNYLVRKDFRLITD